jgi:hypothetical protein
MHRYIASSNGVDSSGQGRDWYRFEQTAGCPSAYGLQGAIGVGHVREHENASGRDLLSQNGDGSEARLAGQHQIEQDNRGQQGLSLCDGLGAIGGFPDHDDTRFAVEQAAEASA